MTQPCSAPPGQPPKPGSSPWVTPAPVSLALLRCSLQSIWDLGFTKNNFLCVQIWGFSFALVHIESGMCFSSCLNTGVDWRLKQNSSSLFPVPHTWSCLSAAFLCNIHFLSTPGPSSLCSLRRKSPEVHQQLLSLPLGAEQGSVQPLNCDQGIPSAVLPPAFPLQ